LNTGTKRDIMAFKLTTTDPKTGKIIIITSKRKDGKIEKLQYWKDSMKKNKLETVAAVGKKKRKDGMEIYIQETPTPKPKVRRVLDLGNRLMENRRPVFILSSAVHLYAAKKLDKPNTAGDIIPYGTHCYNILWNFGQVLRQPDMGRVIAAPVGGLPPGDTLTDSTAEEERTTIDENEKIRKDLEKNILLHALDRSLQGQSQTYKIIKQGGQELDLW